ncbi:MAG: TenA family transcriptional regulator [Actinobacteria bacterium]|nr:TenA family transcriptional regulator [Actinomycetota bacterium]
MLATDLPSRAPDLWASATRSPFLDAVRDGTLPTGWFDTWLAQDALFVADLLRFQARLLARAPRPAQAVLAGGAVALVEELAWFEQLAEQRGLDLDADPLPATRGYADLLQRMDAAPYADAVAALWVVEKAYLDAWTSALPGAAAYRELVEHWTSPGFAEYVQALERLTGPADEALLTDVLRQEAAFWRMTLA